LYYSLSQQSGRTGQFVTFTDFSENGRLDVILQKIDANGVPQLVFLYDNIITNNFYFKALMLNSPQVKSGQLFDDVAIGASFRFILTSTDG